MRRGRWFAVALCLLTLGPTASWAAEAESTPERPVPLPASARREGNIIRVNTRPTILTWAPGVEDAADLDEYAATGLNTLAVPITATSDEELSKAFALASAGEERGLLIVAALGPEPFKNASGESIPVDPTSDAYVAAVHDFVQKAVDRMDSHPRLIGWVVEAVSPDQVVWNDDGFHAFLKQAYKTVGDLNQSWDSDFSDFADVTVSGCESVDSAKPGGIGRARLDLAEYRRKTYADTMALWAKALLRANPDRLVLAGDLTDYRSMISLGPDFDGLIAGTTPGVAEDDTTTSNIQGVDIARRANQFAALQTLDLSSQPAASVVGNWINLALLHGASGLVFSKWAVLAASDDLRAEIKQATGAIKDTAWFPATPVASAAVLYEPYAGGALQGSRGLYGYLDGITPGEPSSLFENFQNGSRYGLLDVLSLDSLASADLAKYSVLFVPAAFDLPEEAQLALNQFVLRGGALVTDAGIGMYQGDGTIDSIPDIVRDTLGLRARLTDEEQPSETAPEPATDQSVPPVPSGPVAVPVKPVTSPSAAGEAAALLDWLDELLQEPEASKYLGSSFTGTDAPSLRVHGLGKGFTVYAPAFLYQQWDANSDSFAQFHDHILSWGHDTYVVNPDALWPDVTVAAYADTKAVGVAAPTNTPAAVDLTFTPNQVYSVPEGAERVMNPADGDSIELYFPGYALSVAEPLPITATPLNQGATAVVSVWQYRSDSIQLTVNGDGAEAVPARDGVAVRGGEATPVEIVIRDGKYRVAPGSMHRAVWREGRRVVADTTVMPNADTGAIVLQGNFAGASLEITPTTEKAPATSEGVGEEPTGTGAESEGVAPETGNTGAESESTGADSESGGTGAESGTGESGEQ